VRDNAKTQQEWVYRELRRELQWFDERLEVPERIFRRLGRHDFRSGICWFQPGAREHINRARYVAWLMSEQGTCVETIKTDCVGPVIWQDNHQLVAIASKAVPRAFH
jgi:hypothetical protein